MFRKETTMLWEYHAPSNLLCVCIGCYIIKQNIPVLSMIFYSTELVATRIYIYRHIWVPLANLYVLLFVSLMKFCSVWRYIKQYSNRHQHYSFNIRITKIVTWYSFVDKVCSVSFQRLYYCASIKIFAFLIYK